MKRSLQIDDYHHAHSTIMEKEDSIADRSTALGDPPTPFDEMEEFCRDRRRRLVTMALRGAGDEIAFLPD